ncbi:serine/threonine-protein phosphatase 4 regulatory subunit 2-like [Vanessa atalanta]|uniref:serine/threonine-protein phosphatase 4 regulatory subunit 2-like n=1 Tax=Vanessa atalanta TaxID=42275 RepID=UPI001FCDE0AE|nr:serine/threonine-protein phosphatase 4 regulatory subunit 2-like [Vanessa atalanta]
MDNAEEIFHFLEEFSKRKQKTIPQELNDYLAYVARTGDPVYQWSLVKSLFKEKLLNVITDFYDTTPGIDIPPYPNVDPFNYDIMKNSLLERLDSFTSAPFTVQRICELLTYPRKQYNRVDKFMRAIEKNILVVSTREPGFQRLPEPENGEPMEAIVNGSDNNSEYNVDVEMEDMSWKDNPAKQTSEPQPGSSDAHISVDDIEARLHAKQETSLTQDKAVTQYESVTPPELNITENIEDPEQKPKETASQIPSTSEDVKNNNSSEESPETKMDVEMKGDVLEPVIIPEIKVDDAETTEQKLCEESNLTKNVEPDTQKESIAPTEITDIPADESSSDSTKAVESKNTTELSSSEESSSSDNTDGNSNSPKTEEHIDVQDESQSNKKIENSENIETNATEISNSNTPSIEEKEQTHKIESENYSISDVQSELPKVSVVVENKTEELEKKENIIEKEKEETEIVATETNAES